MIWLWAIFGGFLGLIFDEGEAFGFFVGVALAVLFVRWQELQNRLAAAESELELIESQVLRLTPASVSPETEASASAADVRTPEGFEKVRTAGAADAAPIDTGPSDTAPTDADLAGADLAAADLTDLDPAVPRPTGETPAVPPPPTGRATTAPGPAAEWPMLSVEQRPSEPSPLERGFEAIKSWFTEGNVPVRIGVLVLFAGVAAALRFAAAEGYLRMPIEWRLSLIAASALVALGFGWRERLKRPVFGLSLQGGAIGVLLLTIFASYRLFQLLPASLAFGLVVVLVMGGCLLAVLQRNMTLAVLALLGGYLAPVLLSTGSGQHVALFSFYAVLNAGVLAISWKERWRLLNLMGFVFTFGVGALWFAESYRPEMFWTVQPFLVLFFLFYVLIGLLYVVRRPHGEGEASLSPGRAWLDGSLVFGTPLVAFPMQAVLLQDQPMALAFSSLTVAGIYLGLLLWLRRRRHERLLTEAYGALALGFVTLAIPLAFSASTTGSLWALQGAAIAWLGLRQQRQLAWLAGLALQPMAAVAYVIGQVEQFGRADLPLLNSSFLGAAFLSLGGLILARLHDQYRRGRFLPALLMLWTLGWWTVAGISQIDIAARFWHVGAAGWHFFIGYLAVTALLAGVLRRARAWPRATWALVLASFFGLVVCVLWSDGEFGSPLALEALPGWFGYLAALFGALWLGRQEGGRSLAAAHGAGLWTIAAVTSLHVYSLTSQALGSTASGWLFMASVAPIGLMTLGLWRRPRGLAWPRAEAFESGYRWLWFAPASAFLAFLWLHGLVEAGAADPLPFMPLLNPLELSLVATGLLLWGFCRERLDDFDKTWPIWGAAAFALVSSMTLRAVHHLHGEAWSAALYDSGFAQTSLTVVWSLLGVSAWVAGSRLLRRPLWMVGAGMMALVLIKLLVVDRQFMGNIAGIVSFLAVGLLLVGVGYFAPSPPAEPEAEGLDSESPNEPAESAEEAS